MGETVQGVSTPSLMAEGREEDGVLALNGQLGKRLL